MELTEAQVALHNLATLVAIIALVIAVVLAWDRKFRCAQCDHCQAEKKREEEARHKEIHKAYGWCGDRTCPLYRKNE